MWREFIGTHVRAAITLGMIAAVVAVFAYLLKSGILEQIIANAINQLFIPAAILLAFLALWKKVTSRGGGQRGRH